MKINSFKLLAALCTAAMAINSGCASPADSTASLDSHTNNTPINEQTDIAAQSATITPDVISKDDKTAAIKADCSIVFSEDSVAIDGEGAHNSATTAVITKAGTYRISGECSNGSILINADGDHKVNLILDNVKLACIDGPVIRCENADKLIITLAENSESILSDGESYSDTEEDSPDAAIFSRDDLLFNGNGSLIVNAKYLDGIKCKDGLKIADGTITVNARDDGIVGKDYLIIGGGSVNVISEGDSLKSTNSTEAELGYISIDGGTVNISTDSDAVDACTQLFISGGEISAVTGGGSATVEHTSDGGFGGRGDFFTDKDFFDFDNLTDESGSTAGSLKGLKADSGIYISTGTINLDCADDAIHSGAVLSISDGTLNLSSGDDGLHADDNLTVSGGKIDITKSYEAIEGLSIDINGGIINATASDDGMNAAGGDNASHMGFGGDTSQYYISITDGDITLNAAGDGVDSNGTVALSGGTLTVFGPQNGANGALDYQTSFAVSGGTLIALGTKQMAMAPSTLSQPCLSVYSSVAADTTLEVLDESGNVIISTITPKSCDSLVFSSDKLTEGSTYTITANGNTLSTIEATDGVSGNGATGSGFGDWDGMEGFGGNRGRGEKPYNNQRPDNGSFDGTMPTPPEGFTPPEMPDGEMQSPPQRPDDGEMPHGTPPELPQQTTE